MKDYKVIKLNLGLSRRAEKFEELLNQYAREGWQVKHVGQGWTSLILERDKNR